MIRLTRPPCPNPAAAAGNYKHQENKDALRSASYDKCMYCESKISHVYHGDVEHIKPKSRYLHLEFVWENLGFVCAKCNGAKSDKYDEDFPFINPYDENPSDYLLAYGSWLFHRPGAERGEISIREIDLNRTGLMERRTERMKRLQVMADKIENVRNGALKQRLREELNKEADQDREFSLVSKSLIAALTNAGVQQ